MESKFQRLNRRQVLKAGLISASTLGILEGLTWKPIRVAQAAPMANLPEIQFDLGAFIAPAKTLNDGGQAA